MGIVKGPALSIDASGNVGSICYSKWRGLQVARAVWSGGVSPTAKQISQQAKLTEVSQRWGQALSSEERYSWVTLARTIVWRNRFGGPYIPNGYQLFMKWNIRRRVMNLSFMHNAPAAQERPYVEFLSLLNLTPLERIRIRLHKKDTEVIDGYGVEYYKAGPYSSGGRNPIDGEWRFLIRIVPPWATTDFTVTFGKWYWYRGRSCTEFGDVGNWFQEQIHLVE